MKSNGSLVWLLATATLFGLITTTAFAFTGQKYASNAKVSIEQARGIAVRTYPGQIDSEELEKESGGSGLRYSFVIKNKNVSHEVGVDAKTGEVLENSLERAHAD